MCYNRLCALHKTHRAALFTGNVVAPTAGAVDDPVTGERLRMSLPTLDAITGYATLFFAIMGGLLAALWLSLVIWAFRDMRLRSRDPFAQVLAALVVAALPGVGLLIYVILRPPETLAEAYERALEEEALLQEIEERPSCPGCSRTVHADWLLCAYCHTRLKKKCADCGELQELQWTLCPFCGNNHIDPYHVAPAAPQVTEPALPDMTYDEAPEIGQTVPLALPDEDVERVDEGPRY